ncbi:MAG TPA: recombinase zinc beta ribbon domain-containing protein [Candidatus Solibacter sp.]|nr:recombinase zinc beta ribbon domain-containing protein [Candidatus Solibacter sp.]
MINASHPQERERVAGFSLKTVKAIATICCQSRMVIISGCGKRGYAKYGCPSHRYRGICKNAVTIRQDRLEAQLLTALEQRLSNPQMIEYTLTRFHEELERRLLKIQKEAAGLEELLCERRQLQEKAKRISEAIAEAGHSPTLLSSLATLEGKIAAVDSRMETHAPVDVTAAVGEIREFVYRNVLQLRTLLRGDAAKAKASLARHLGELVLTPTHTPAGPVYEVAGGFDLLAGNKDVMPVVARDGYPLHTTLFQIPLTDVYLDPRLDLR